MVSKTIVITKSQQKKGDSERYFSVGKECLSLHHWASWLSRKHFCLSWASVVEYRDTYKASHGISWVNQPVSCHRITLGNNVIKPDTTCSVWFVMQYFENLSWTHSKGNLKKTFNNLTKEQVWACHPSFCFVCKYLQRDSPALVSACYSSWWPWGQGSGLLERWSQCWTSNDSFWFQP